MSALLSPLPLLLVSTLRHRGAWSIATVRVLLEADKDTLVEHGDFNIAMITRALKGAQGAGSTFNEQGVIIIIHYCI